MGNHPIESHETIIFLWFFLWFFTTNTRGYRLLPGGFAMVFVVKSDETMTSCASGGVSA